MSCRPEEPIEGARRLARAEWRREDRKFMAEFSTCDGISSRVKFGRWKIGNRKSQIENQRESMGSRMAQISFGLGRARRADLKIGHYIAIAGTYIRRGRADLKTGKNRRGPARHREDRPLQVKISSRMRLT